MMNWNRIMWAVAAPGDVETETGAAAKAARLAIALGAELEIFHCVYDPDIARPERFASRGVEVDIREIVERRHEQLERNAERLRAQGLRIHTNVRWDSPAHEGIVRRVLRRAPDLLIAQSAPRSRSERLGLAQTDLKLIETCPCPLLLVKTSRPYTAARIVAAADPMHSHDKPAALDGAIIDAARTMAAALSMDLVVFHAVDLRSGPKEAVEARIRELAERQSVEPRNVRVVEGMVEERLPAFVRSEGADVVAMGAVSRSLVKRVLLGHTAERLLGALDADVLIVKPPGFVSPVKARSVHRTERVRTESGKYVF